MAYHPHHAWPQHLASSSRLFGIHELSVFCLPICLACSLPASSPADPLVLDAHRMAEGSVTRLVALAREQGPEIPQEQLAAAQADLRPAIFFLALVAAHQPSFLQPYANTVANWLSASLMVLEVGADDHVFFMVLLMVVMAGGWRPVQLNKIRGRMAASGVPREYDSVLPCAGRLGGAPLLPHPQGPGPQPARHTLSLRPQG